MTLAQYLMLNCFTSTDPDAMPLWFWAESTPATEPQPVHQDSSDELLPAIEWR